MQSCFAVIGVLTLPNSNVEIKFESYKGYLNVEINGIPYGFDTQNERVIEPAGFYRNPQSMWWIVEKQDVIFEIALLVKTAHKYGISNAVVENSLKPLMQKLQ